MSPTKVGESAVPLIETPSSKYQTVIKILEPVLDTKNPAILYAYGIAVYNGKKDKKYIPFIVESAKNGFQKARQFLCNKFYITFSDIDKKSEEELLSDLIEQ